MERFEVPDQVGALMPVRQAMLHREVGCQSVVAWAPANRMQRVSVYICQGHSDLIVDRK